MKLNKGSLDYMSKKVIEYFHQYEIIDNHIHIGKGEGVWFYPDVNPEEIDRILDSMGIKYGIVFPNYHPKYPEANEEVFEIQQKYEKLIGFGRINTGRAKIFPMEKFFTGPRNFLSAGLTNLIIRKNSIDTLAEIEKCIRQYHFSGIKIAPGVDGQLGIDEVRLIRELDVPILIHDDPDNIYEKILKKFPDTKIILPHLGGYPNNSENYHKAIELAIEYKNFYLDISGVMFQYILHKAISEVPEKIIFGSDLPAEHPAAVAMLLLTTETDENRLQKVFSGNIKKLVQFS